MAKLSICVIFMVSCLFIIAMPSSYARKQAVPVNAEEEAWFQNNICRGNEKLAKIHFYVQDLLSGENETVYEVARASITSNSNTDFGQIRVLDDLMTAEPDRNSEKVGRAQGLITSSDLEISALTMNLNFYFTSGKYNGSTICILGRNQIDDDKRELAVVGGTGMFRFTRGYAFSSTKNYTVVPYQYGILEYTIYATYVDKPYNMRLETADI